MAKEPLAVEVFTPPVEVAGGDPAMAEEALRQLEAPDLVEASFSPGTGTTEGEGASSPAPKLKGARRGLASTKHSKKQLRDNIKGLLDENDKLRASAVPPSPAAEVAPMPLDAVALAQAEEEAAGAVKFFATDVFDVLVKVRGGHWKQSEEKLTRLGKVWGKPLAKHWAGGNPWLMAALTTLVMLGPSIAEEVKRAEQRTPAVAA